MTKLEILKKIRDDLEERVMRWEIDLDVNKKRVKETTDNIALQGIHQAADNCERTIKELKETLQMTNKHIIKESKKVPQN